MAASLATVVRNSRMIPNMVMRLVDVTGDTSYPAGGYSISAADVDLKNIFVAIPVAVNGYEVDWDVANGKLKLFKNSGTPTSNPMVEVTAATNVSAVTVRMLFIGEHK